MTAKMLALAWDRDILGENLFRRTMGWLKCNGKAGVLKGESVLEKE